MWRKSAPFAPPCGEISKLLIGDWKLQAADGSAVSYPLPPARHFHPNLPAIIHESERDGKEEGEGYKKETPQSKATLNSEGGKSQKQTTTKIKRLWNNRVQKFGLRQRRYDGGRRCHFPPSSKFFPHGVINTSVTFLRLCPCGIPQRRSLRLWDFERNGQQKKKKFLFCRCFNYFWKCKIEALRKIADRWRKQNERELRDLNPRSFLFCKCWQPNQRV